MTILFCKKHENLIRTIYNEMSFNVKQTSLELVRLGHESIHPSTLRRFLIRINLLRPEQHPRDEKKRGELVSLRTLIEDLYINQLMSAHQIRNELLKQGKRFSVSMITSYLAEWNVKRTLSESNSIRKLSLNICESCNLSFTPNAPKQRCCETCVPPNSRSRGLWAKFKLTSFAYDSLLRSQNNKCKLCDCDFTNLKQNRVHVDHCHESGQVRGILCQECNHFISKIDNTSGWGERALTYCKS